MARAGCLAIVALLLAVPLAAASSASVSGSFSTKASLHLSPSAQGEGVVLAAYWPNASGVESFSQKAARMHVEVFQFERISTSLIKTQVANRSYSFDVTDAEARIVETPTQGWIGYYAALGGDGAGLGASALDLSPRSDPVGTTNEAAGGAKESSVPSYSFVPQEPYVFAEGALSFMRAGPASTKLFGPTVEIVARENDTRLSTGVEAGQAPGTDTVRWLVVTSDASVRVVSSRPAQIALASATLSTQALQIRQAVGSISTSAGSDVLGGRDAILVGDLTVHAASAPGSSPSLDARVEGDVTDTSLVFASPPAVPLAASGFLVIAGAGLVGFLLVALVARQAAARRKRAFSPEQLVELAYAAADDGRYGDALAWIRKAREHAPTSERLQLDEAAFQVELGQADEALARLLAIGDASSTGEADFHAAALMLELGLGALAARPVLLRALSRTPHLALELEDDPTFAPMRQDPVVTKAMSAALRRLDGLD